MQRVDGGFTYQKQYHSITQDAQTNVKESTAVRQEGLQLTKGTVFEGVVTEIKDGYVQLSLNNGQNLRAMLDAGVKVQLGEPVLFEVKSNQEGQILLRQLPVSSAQNPTLQKALVAAGLTATQRNLNMVDIMMRSQLPIDKESLTAMARQLQKYPRTSPETLVQMKKFGFEITESSIQQFEAYKSGEHSLVQKFTQLMEQLPDFISGNGNDAEKILDMQNQILDIFVPDQETENLGKLQQTADVETGKILEAIGVETGKSNLGKVAEATVQNESSGKMAEVTVQTEGLGKMAEAAVQTENPGELTEAKNGILTETVGVEAENQGKTMTGMEKQVAAGNAETQRTVSGPTYLTAEEMRNFEQQLRQIPELANDERLFEEGQLKTGLTAKELLSYIKENLQQANQPEVELLKELFGGKEYKTLVRQVIEEQWFLEPQQVEEKQNMEQLYERMNRQLERLEHLLQSSGKEAMAINKDVTQVRGNLEMMNQINQLYNYVQIPLKLHGQNAHSDLYVYTNKKRLLDKDGELSALLHLELETLGTTDVEIKMLQSNVTTNFYLSDDISYSLIKEHMEELKEILQKKGYHCSIQIENREKKTDFVQDFLERENTGGALQRYSFDVRA